MSEKINAMKQALAAGEKFIAKVHAGLARSTETYDELQHSNMHLREAIAVEEAQTVEPFAWLAPTNYGGHDSFEVATSNTFGAFKVFTHPAPATEPSNPRKSYGGTHSDFASKIQVPNSEPAKPTGEREALIESHRWLAEHGANIDVKALARKTADMLAADACSASRERHARETLRKVLAGIEAQQVAVPQGWQLVPISPDLNMAEAGRDAELFAPSCRSSALVYRAMIAAARNPQQQEEK